LDAKLVSTDGLIVAVKNTDYVVTPGHFAARQAERNQQENTGARDFICVDVGVPRSIDPEVGALPQVRLRNIDDLGGQIQQTLAKRRQEIAAAEALVEETLDEFTVWFNTRRAAPMIADLQRYVDGLCRNEIARYVHGFHPQDEEKLAKFSHSLAKRIIRGPIQQLRALAADGDESSFATLQRFFEFTAGEHGQEEEKKQPQPAQPERGMTPATQKVS
jgi:glutamyl-tRNA reductase